MADPVTSANDADAVARRIAEAAPPPGFAPIVHSSPFGAHNGPFFERRRDAGWARGMRVLDRHTNAGGIAHGGMLMTFADIVLGQAVYVSAGAPALTVRLVTDFLAPARAGDWVEGSAEISRQTRNLVFVEGRLRVGDSTVLTASGIFRLVRRPADAA